MTAVLSLNYLDSRPLFVLFSALNRNGYDLEGNPEMHPIRLWLREQVAALPADPYFARALPGWPRAGWLGCALFCLDDRYDWRVDPEPLWDEIAWESPEPIDADARAWLRELPARLRWWETQLATLASGSQPGLWEQYQALIRQREPAGIRDAIAAGVRERLSGSPFSVSREPVIVPNYLQSDWSTDPVHIGERVYIITGPLSLRTVGGIVHEALHETFGPLLRPIREQLGEYVAAFSDDRALLTRWGYWNADPAKTVFKVFEECCVRAAGQWLQGAGPDDGWDRYGLGLARAVLAHFEQHGLFRDSEAVKAFLAARAAAPEPPASSL
ncbi:MAG: hypothetical protein ACM3XN_06625 [Chloroflexota bacterium]